MKNIKKLLGVGIMSFCVGCSSANTKEVNLNDVMSKMGSEVSMEGMIEFTKNDLSDYYGIEEENVKQFSARVHNSGIKSDEIVLIEASDSKNAEIVKDKLQERYQSKVNENSSYNPTELAVIEKCKVSTNGNYVSMIVSPEVEKLEKVYNDSFK